MKRRLISFFVLAFASAAFGHAFVDHATPKVGSTVSDAPTQVQIVFTDDLKDGASTIQVLDANGKEVDKQDSHVDPKNKSLMTVSLNPIPAGTYKVVWNAVSVDTHKTHGDFEFTYQPKG